MTDRPYSVATLAERWDCHEDVVRRLISRGALLSFRVGDLIRVRASEVERYECNGSALQDTGAGTSSNTTMVTDATAERSARETWRRRMQKQAT